jgi:hypothetical protein
MGINQFGSNHIQNRLQPTNIGNQKSGGGVEKR